MTVALTGWRVHSEITRQQLEAGHADGNAHLNLMADNAAVDVVGDFAVYLDSAIHRPRMHDESVRLGHRKLVVIETKKWKYSRVDGTKAAMHTLSLQAPAS